MQELQSWVNAVAYGPPTGPSAWDGYAAAAVSQACVDSLRTGRAVDVPLEPRPELYADPRPLAGQT